MRKVPPLVFAKVIYGRPAYLLEWQRLPAMQGGGWGARIVWVELDEAGALVRQGWRRPREPFTPAPCPASLTGGTTADGKIKLRYAELATISVGELQPDR